MSRYEDLIRKPWIAPLGLAISLLFFFWNLWDVTDSSREDWMRAIDAAFLVFWAYEIYAFTKLTMEKYRL